MKFKSHRTGINRTNFDFYSVSILFKKRNILSNVIFGGLKAAYNWTSIQLRRKKSDQLRFNLMLEYFGKSEEKVERESLQ